LRTLQTGRAAHIGNQIIEVLNHIFMKRAASQITIVPEKSAHNQINANTGEDDNHQKLGEN
jgi:hypothetical protein